MKNHKTLSIIYSIVGIGVICLSGITGGFSGDLKFNYPGKVYKKEVKIGEEVIQYELKIYQPPISMPNHFYESEKEANLSEPEDVINALYSSLNRNKKWFLSLHTKMAAEWIIKGNKKSNGKYLEEFKKGKPYESPIKSGNYDKLLYRMDYKSDSFKRSIIFYVAYIDGDPVLEGIGFKKFIFKNSKWLVCAFNEGNSKIEQYFHHRPLEQLIGEK
ncbi:MAG: hypothetical protein RAO92_08750 [Candidatus Euphemobacter frigidus]|nr:hypothetical protein [Candidatus Euphemobacter frigidus]MDP8276476.1 hypothetical protein [Candidatus Euphemobacter frigidus]